MKKTFKIIALTVCLVISVTFLSACNLTGNCTLISAPAEGLPLTQEELSADGYKSLKDGAKEFSYSFSQKVTESFTASGNFAVSPISVYSALALAAECADGETRDQILNALNVSYADLSANYGTLYRYLQRTFDEGRLSLSNSVWLQNGLPFNQSCIDSLSQKYFCYSYYADFAGDNKNANRAVRNFIKEQTNGLLDLDLNLSDQTLFTLINAIYLKDVWLFAGEELTLTEQKYTFDGEDGQKDAKFLIGKYVPGRIYRVDGFNMFYTTTLNGYKLKFVLPDDGVSADSLFNAATLKEINSLTDFDATDHAARVHYHTRCLFPEFDCEFNEDIVKVLRDLGISDLFYPTSCDMSNLLGATSSQDAYCSQIIHAAKLNVDRTGIEGAAITAIPTAGEAGPDGYQNVYEDFIVDGSFAFIITDQSDMPLFSGIIRNI